MALNKINYCPPFKLRLELGFYRFTSAESGVVKFSNKLDLCATITHMDTKFGNPSYRSF